jgi:hypothetical protein
MSVHLVLLDLVTLVVFDTSTKTTNEVPIIYDTVYGNFKLVRNVRCRKAARR